MPEPPGPRWLQGLTRAWLRLPAPVRVAAPVAWAALIWWSSSRPAGGGTVPLWLNLLSNGAHLGIYGVLAWLAVWALGSPGQRPARLVWGVLLAVAYGVVDEWHQSMVPGRVASLADLLSDAFGAAFSAMLLGWWHGVRRPRAVELVLLALGGCGAVAWAVFG